MNNVRIIRCGSTTLVIGQLFDPEDLAHPGTPIGPAEVPVHCFDHLGMRPPSNDNDGGEHRDRQMPDGSLSTDKNA